VGFIKGLLWPAGFAAVLGLLLYAFVFDLWRVPSDDPALAASIETTLSAGDLLLVRRSGDIEYGMLARCTDPDAPGRFVVGRAMGMPGDTISVYSTGVKINDKVLSTSNGCDERVVTVADPRDGHAVELACATVEYGGINRPLLRTLTPPPKETVAPATVDHGRVYMVSDDLIFHLDSRDYGPLVPSTCRHVVFRLWGGAGFSDAKHRLSLLW
jgi:signal peptidase I